MKELWRHISLKSFSDLDERERRELHDVTSHSGSVAHLSSCTTLLGLKTESAFTNPQTQAFSSESSLFLFFLADGL